MQALERMLMLSYAAQAGAPDQLSYRRTVTVKEA